MNVKGGGGGGIHKQKGGGGGFTNMSEYHKKVGEHVPSKGWGSQDRG